MRWLCAMLALAMLSGLPAGSAEPYKFDPSKLRTLLDKDQSSRSKDRPRLTFGWIRSLQSRLESCWHRPAGIANSDDIAVRIRFGLNPDGSLSDGPTIVEFSKHPLGKAFAESAVEAIKRCQPYAFLPTDEYKGGWDKLDMTFSSKTP